MAPSRSNSFRALAFGSNKRKSSPGPPSPTFSESTHASVMNFGAGGPEKIITRANLKASLQAYEELMNTSASYRAALMTMSKVTAAFADALERCSGLKGPSYEAGTRLQAASGLHHLIGNHWHVLAETIDKKFERPLRQHLETYRTIVADRSASYEHALREKSQVIRDTEMRSMNRKERNLQTFRDALSILQQQVDDLDELKASHYREIIEHEEQVWEVVQGKVCVVVRSTMDVFDRFTAKSSDPILEPMLQSVPDPFDSYGPPQAEDQIFSILAPLSIMTHAHASSSNAVSMESATFSDKITSWLPKASNGDIFPSEATEWAGSPESTPPRSVSPPASSRRHSMPPTAGSRKAESKLRSVLSVIDEYHPQYSSSQDTASGSTNLQSNTGHQPNWSFTYGQSPYEHTEDDSTTPRHSSSFLPQSPPPPTTEPLDFYEPKETNELAQPTLAPAVS
ncbi:hypothetical protein L208DRAFT_1397441 [Tricholoma matsutake]|nr:hypothetical protein L208DRAFT_1397441 [Tricholoma matsutake 945]